MYEDDVRLHEQLNDGVRNAVSNNDPADPTDHTPTGMGSEAAEGINDMGAHVQGERSGLDDRQPGSSFRDGAERSGSEPLLGHTWVHESGYGGRLGEPRTSSDQREDSERGSSKREGCEQESGEQRKSRHDLPDQA